ncbi:21771_t:CDS:2 [Gigaspora margarita]|uniref:21771_t:CDS:1 n=1 Tax=Gigaspora margarita TaxID=4874 RepID=A0ABM8W3S4_GIGMA|nr:21771_t:CDS:2 [Gigaspora margarita]
MVTPKIERKRQQHKQQYDNMTIPEISNTSQRNHSTYKSIKKSKNTYELQIKCQSDSIATKHQKPAKAPIL